MHGTYSRKPNIRAMIQRFLGSSFPLVLPLALPLVLQAGCGDCTDAAGSKQLAAGASVFLKLSGESCQAHCPQPADTCTLKGVVGSGPLTVECYTKRVCTPPTAVEGRRPAGLKLGGCEGDEVGRFFAEVHQLEAVSVVAFEVLAEDLRAHGAPASLIEAALASAQDEVRHAKMTAALMRRYGGRAEAPTVEPPKPGIRSLVEIAMENEIEGCVRESYGAFMAAWQAEAAQDKVVRRVMAQIAPDELRHAELAYAIAEWAEAHLDPEQRAQVAAAKNAEFAALRSALQQEPSARLVTLAGIPSAQVAEQFAAEMAGQHAA